MSQIKRLDDIRNIICDYCKEEVLLNSLDTIHLNPKSDQLCPKFFSLCPYNCSVKERVILKDHLFYCESKTLKCPFHCSDCQIGNMTQEFLAKHFQDEFVKTISCLQNEISNLKTDISTIRSEVQNQQDQSLIKLKASNEFRNKVEKNSDRVRKITPSTLQNYERETIFRNGCYIWKIKNFNLLKTEAENGGRISITSDPFYTSEFGYKLCLRIYPIGFGVGLGTYLSVYFIILKGEFDDLLTWPFKQKVTLTILDLEDGTTHYSETIKPDPKSPSYQKPIDDSKLLSGSSKFISFSRIMNGSNYCKDNTIFLKLSIDTFGLTKP